MRHLNIQLQADRAPRLDRKRLEDLIRGVADDRSLVAGFETREGEDEGPYVNFTFLAKDLKGLWSAVRRDVLGDPEVGPQAAESTIVVCEGPGGWEDYRLLHHYNPALEPDALDED